MSYLFLIVPIMRPNRNAWIDISTKNISFTNFVFNNFITGVIHIRIFRPTSGAHRLVIVHKLNGLPAEITCHSFFKIVKAHI